MCACPTFAEQFLRSVIIWPYSTVGELLYKYCIAVTILYIMYVVFSISIVIIILMPIFPMLYTLYIMCLYRISQ